MGQQIIIVGGGISGLSLLHYLKKRYSQQQDLQILLLEKNAQVGGTTHTEILKHGLFEHGPNGFLSHKEDILTLIDELGLSKELIKTSPGSQNRYICIKDRLHALPTHPFEILTFQPLSFIDKIRIPLEIFIPQGKNPDETAFEFVKRRFGQGFVQLIFDPFISGIFAGDPHQLHFRSAFPDLYSLEADHGSILKGLLKKMGQKKRQSPQGTSRPHFLSLQKGMSQLMECLHLRYQDHIRLREEVKDIHRQSKGFTVETQQTTYFAEELFISTPAYQAARMVKGLNSRLSHLLSQIPYAPVAVVALILRKTAFPLPPVGFGYLIPSSEGKGVLGVLFCSCLFPNRTDPDCVLLRVMLGGALHPNIINSSPEELINLAIQEIQQRFHPKENPVETACVIWPQGIPQYNLGYPQIKTEIKQELIQLPHLHLVANYLNGISFNDCIQNALKASQSCVL